MVRRGQTIQKVRWADSYSTVRRQELSSQPCHKLTVTPGKPRRSLSRGFLVGEMRCTGFQQETWHTQVGSLERAE